MAKSTGSEGCCPPSDGGAPCCSVDAILGVDERGQMVLPKEMRQKAGIGAGDKLAAVSLYRDAEVCCIALIKVDELTPMVKGMLGPVMGRLLQE